MTKRCHIKQYFILYFLQLAIKIAY